MIYPSTAAHTAKAASSWGFTLVHDPTDGLYHGMVAVACNASGVIAQGGGDSWIAHVVSSQPDTGFTFRAMAVPQTTFGPHLAVNPEDNSFVMVFRVNVLVNTTLCAGTSTTPLPSPFENPYVPYDSIVSGDPEGGTSIYIAWAPTMNGPWSVVRTNITGAGNVHKSNPSIAPLQLPIGPYKWIMAYRWNPPGGESNAIALASDFRGPWQCVANISTDPHLMSEDPFVFQLPGQPDTAHIIYHAKDHGFHAFGPVNGSAPWQLSPTGSFAFTLNVTMSDGSTLYLQRRERPELLFDSTGKPTALINGVVAPDGSAYTFMQPVQN